MRYWIHVYHRNEGVLSFVIAFRVVLLHNMYIYLQAAVLSIYTLETNAEKVTAAVTETIQDYSSIHTVHL